MMPACGASGPTVLPGDAAVPDRDAVREQLVCAVRGSRPSVLWNIVQRQHPGVLEREHLPDMRWQRGSVLRWECLQLGICMWEQRAVHSVRRGYRALLQQWGRVHWYECGVHRFHVRRLRGKSTPAVLRGIGVHGKQSV